jgi:hypothetical protein
MSDGWWRNCVLTVVVDNPSWVLPWAEKIVEARRNIGARATLVRRYDDIEPGGVALFLGCTGIAPQTFVDRSRRSLVIHESDLPEGRGLDYATVASYLLVPATGYTIVDGAKCASPEKIGAELNSALPSWAQRLPLPGAVRSDLHLLERFCRGDLFVQRRDGSTYDHRNRTPILNENPLDARESALQLGDEVEIAKILKALHDLIPPNVKYAILVPPVYETQRESSVDAIFSRALALVPEVVVIDHRHKYRAAEYFIDYDHPNDRYFALLTKELLERQILARKSD